MHWLIGRSKKAGELYRRLEQLGRDAGVDVGFRGWAVQALEINGELDRLLETLDEWQDVAGEDTGGFRVRVMGVVAEEQHHRARGRGVEWRVRDVDHRRANFDR